MKNPRVSNTPAGSALLFHCRMALQYEINSSGFTQASS
jgi:hypothetical protein